MRSDPRRRRAGLDASDDRFLAGVAAAIARRGLAGPALLGLEWLRPLSFVGSQLMQALAPFVSLTEAGGDWQRLADLLEQRPQIDRLLAHLDAATAPEAQTRRLAGPPDGAYVITDCGSTTTKAVLLVHHGGCYRLAGRAESPTTVEAPVEDVLCGVRSALTLLQELTGHPFLADDGNRILPATDAHHGVRACLATSSAGGGLQMVVVGLVRAMTAESAARAALGAGAIITAVFAHNDPDDTVTRLERLRLCRPDIVLISGGTDEGAVAPVVGLAELVAAAGIRPRYGEGRLPVVFAGNPQAAEGVTTALAAVAEVVVAPNVRPTLEQERVQPVRACIHDVFLRHVMARAPGYPGLQTLCHAPVLPTPAAFGVALDLLAQQADGDVVAVDLGGATTDVFSVRDGVVRRSVSANLGLSYSLGSVGARAGWETIARWLPGPGDLDSLRDRARNKMVRPTTLPVTWDDLCFEQAAAREALRLALVDHEAAMQPLRGGRDAVTAGGRLAFDLVSDVPPPAIDWPRVRLLLGSGGPLANAPRRTQAALMLVDACRPVGVTELAVDSVFVLPHLGVLRGVDADAAAAVLQRDAIVTLGACVAPVAAPVAPGQPLAQVRLRDPRGDDDAASSVLFVAGELRRLPLAAGQEAHLSIEPQERVDFGAGPGQPVAAWVCGGPAGVVLDGRGRAIVWPSAELSRRKVVRGWWRALDAIPEVWP